MKRNGKIQGRETNGKVVLSALYVTTGSEKGEVNLQWDAVKNVRQYIIQVSANGGTSWKHVDIISEPHYTLGGLTGGKSYSFRIAPVFTGGQDAWSKPVEKKIR